MSSVRLGNTCLPGGKTWGFGCKITLLQYLFILRSSSRSQITRGHSSPRWNTTFFIVSNPSLHLQMSWRTLIDLSCPSNKPSRFDNQWQAESLAKSTWHGREQLDAPFDPHLLVSWRVQNCLIVHLTSWTWTSLSDRVTCVENGMMRESRVPHNKRYCSNPTHLPLPWNIATEVHNKCYTWSSPNRRWSRWWSWWWYRSWFHTIIEQEYFKRRVQHFEDTSKCNVLVVTTSLSIKAWYPTADVIYGRGH